MSFRPPSLSAVAAFEAAARHQSFTAAARELNLTQSAISHGIRALEARVGQRLFERAGRGVRLTDAGRALVGRVRIGMALLGEAFDATARQGSERLIVATLPSIAEHLLIPRLHLFQAAFPALALDIRCSTMLSDVGQGEADVAIRFGPGQWVGLHSLHLADETLFPVASPDYRGGDLPRTVDDLGDCNLIHHTESTWRLWLAPLGIDPASMPTTLAIDDASLALDAARNGLGVALARGRLVEAYLGTGALVRLFEREVPAEYAYWCAWSPQAARRATISAFAEWLREQMAN